MNAVHTPATPVSVLDVLDIVDTALATVALRLPAHVSREDLASAGRLALIASVAQVKGTLDEVRAYSFARVRGAMFDELRRLDPLSRRTRARVTAVRRAAADLEMTYGRAPSDNELADAVGVTPALVRQAIRIGQAADSPDSEPETLASVADHATSTPAEFAENGDLVATLRAAAEKKLREDDVVVALWPATDDRGSRGFFD